jgi:hypothetical protein
LVDHPVDHVTKFVVPLPSIRGDFLGREWKHRLRVCPVAKPPQLVQVLKSLQVAGSLQRRLQVAQHVLPVARDGEIARLTGQLGLRVMADPPGQLILTHAFDDRLLPVRTELGARSSAIGVPGPAVAGGFAAGFHCSRRLRSSSSILWFDVRSVPKYCQPTQPSRPRPASSRTTPSRSARPVTWRPVCPYSLTQEIRRKVLTTLAEAGVILGAFATGAGIVFKVPNVPKAE